MGSVLIGPFAYLGLGWEEWWAGGLSVGAAAAEKDDNLSMCVRVGGGVRELGRRLIRLCQEV